VENGAGYSGGGNVGSVLQAALRFLSKKLYCTLAAHAPKCGEQGAGDPADGGKMWLTFIAKARPCPHGLRQVRWSVDG